jgi:hypothetical protein
MFPLGPRYPTSVCMMEWSTSLSRSASSSSSGNRSGGSGLSTSVRVPQAHSNSRRHTRASEAAPIMLSNFPPPRSYGSLLTYYRFIRNGNVVYNNQVLLVNRPAYFSRNLFLATYSNQNTFPENSSFYKKLLRTEC